MRVLDGFDDADGVLEVQQHNGADDSVSAQEDDRDADAQEEEAGEETVGFGDHLSHDICGYGRRGRRLRFGSNRQRQTIVDRKHAD